LGIRYNKQQQWKKHHELIAVAPKCATGREHFITADGYYSPCCYVADHRFYYKTDFGKNKNRYSITNTSLTGILSQPTVIDFYQSLDSVSACQFNCPKIDQASQEQVPRVPVPAV
jgi:hypothetical protein